MAQNGFNKLPFSVILEISSYLDVKSLVAMADVNKDLRNLSHSYKSYWLSHVLREGLTLPLPSLRPWQSFSPQELGIATRRAVLRDRNILSERPKLCSSTRISWPFSGPGASAEGNGPPLGDKLTNQKPLDVSRRTSLHSNGEWYFTLSRDYTLRVLHLRTAVLVLEEQIYSPNDSNDSLRPPNAYSIHTVDAFEARVTVVTPGNNDFAAQSPYRSVLVTYVITLDPKLVTASSKLLARTPLTVWPQQFDIAGDYAVLVGDVGVSSWDVFWETPEPIHVVEWKTGLGVDLPPLLDSFSIAGFPDYFISLGVDPDGRAELQVVSLPLPKQPLQSGNQCHNDPNNGTGELGLDFILAGSIPLDPGPGVSLNCSGDFATIRHQYTGQTINNIVLWIRGFVGEHFQSNYNIFNVPVDFSKPPEQWFTGLESKSSEESEPARYAVKHKTLTQLDYDEDHAVPGTSGKCFFWWDEIEHPDVPHPSKMILLYSSDTDNLSPPTTPTHPAAWFEFEEMQRYPVREMECPFYGEVLPPTSDEENSDRDEVPDGEGWECVHSVVFEDWSGTALITLTCGDLLVLRYGHP